MPPDREGQAAFFEQYRKVMGLNDVRTNCGWIIYCVDHEQFNNFT